MNYLRWEYPEAVAEGYWGPVTSTIDWCEENYVISPFIAEWSNTVTNAMFLLTALYTTWTAYRDNLEKRFILIGMGFALVGVGSWWFHMTLQYKYQLLDELPMWYATCIPTWSLICEYFDYFPLSNNPNSFFASNDKLKNNFRHRILGWFVTISVLIMTIIYFFWDRNPYFQHGCYAVFTGLVVIISTFITWKKIDNWFYKKNLMWCAGLGALIFALGFICWILDKALCPFWIHIRRDYILLPLGVLLELHGWWHLLTGTGVYYYVVFLQYLRILSTKDRIDDYIFIWRLKLIPELIPKNLANSLWTPYSLEFRGPYVKIKSINTTTSNNDEVTEALLNHEPTPVSYDSTNNSKSKTNNNNNSSSSSKTKKLSKKK